MDRQYPYELAERRFFVYGKIRNGFNRFLDFVNSLTGAALLLIMCIVLMQVFCRLVIFKSLVWSEELSRYLMVFMVLFGLGISVNEDMMIKIDVIDSFFHRDSTRHAFDLIRTLLGLVCSILITVSSTQLFRIGMIQKSAAMQIPMIIMYVVVFLSFVLATISLLFKTIDHVITLKHPVDGKDLKKGSEQE